MKLGKFVASNVIKHRLLLLVAIIIATGFWGYWLKNLNIITRFDDLLPQKHPYIRVYNKAMEIFGGANFLVLALEAKKGDIYNDQTLAKIRSVTGGQGYPLPRALFNVPHAEPRTLMQAKRCVGCGV